jgi:transposase
MNRSSAQQRNERINLAISLLKQYPSSTQVISELQKRFGISQRQAYRYVQEAEKATGLLAIPEPKIVFTVKLPISLVQRLREFARSKRQTISDITAHALERILNRRT